MADGDVPDSTDWLTTPLRALAAVEASLRCQVCKDFYRTPMLTSCSHTFCSLCIRRALSNDGKCPLCRAGEQELKLRSNWSMEETVEAFVKARPDVLAEARKKESQKVSSPKRKANETAEANGDEGAPASKRIRTSARLSKNRAEAPPPQLVNEDDDDIVEVPDDDANDESYSSENHDGLVACPVCNSKMKEWQVFKHLESCTGPPSNTTNGHQAGPSNPLQPSSHRKPSASAPDRLPAIAYSMLKDNALRKKLAELGISNSGPRPLLEKRHKEWVTLWNANCDAAKPKKRSQLLHDLDVWERTQGGRAPTTGRSVQNAALIKDKDFDGKAWGSTHDDSFKDLIEQARRSRKQANKTDDVEQTPEGQPQSEPQSEETSKQNQSEEVISPQSHAQNGTAERVDVVPPPVPQEIPSSQDAEQFNAAPEPLDFDMPVVGSKFSRRGSNDWDNIERKPPF